MTALGRANWRDRASFAVLYIIVGLARQAKFEAVPLSADRLDSWKDIAGYLKRSVRRSGAGKNNTACRSIVWGIRPVRPSSPTNRSSMSGGPELRHGLQHPEER